MTNFPYHDSLEIKAGGFLCSFCHVFIPINKRMGTGNRNHCRVCLWSKHVDKDKPGDRKSDCWQGMKPIGLTFKHEGMDKYGKPRQGELMLIHVCQGCNKVSINRIAADDDTKAILEVFDQAKKLEPQTLKTLEDQHIRVLDDNDLVEIKNQLFGKGHKVAHSIGDNEAPKQ